MVAGIPKLKPGKQEFDVAKFFGEEPPIRITTMATPKMVTERFKHLFGEDPQFTEEIGTRMKEVTKIITGLEPHSTQVVYGERALDMVLGVPHLQPYKQEFDVAKFFGEVPTIRIPTMATPKMIAERTKTFIRRGSPVHGGNEHEDEKGHAGRSAQQQEERIHERSWSCSSI